MTYIQYNKTNDLFAPQPSTTLKIKPGDPVEDMELTVIAIRFKAPDTLYRVIECADNDDHRITVTGNFGDAVAQDLTIRATGRWEQHKRFGLQIKADVVIPLTPTTEEGIIKYLESGGFSGIGPKTAFRIVQHFRLDTIDVLDKHPERLKEVQGIGKKKITAITRSWQDARQVNTIFLDFHQHGLTQNQCMKIYQQYKEKSIETVRKNPYALIETIRGISFTTADSIAKAYGFYHNSQFRLKAALVYTLQAASDEGHTQLPIQVLLTKTLGILNSGDHITKHVKRYEVEDAFYSALDDHTLVEKDGRIDLPYYSAWEYSIAKHVYRIARAKPTAKLPIDSNAISTLENHLGILFSSEQKEVIHSFSENTLTVVTGPPGTGKTTILKALTILASNRNLSVLIGAPTGAAANRARQVTGHMAQTHHRNLGWNPKENHFMYDEEVPFVEPVHFYDESTMMDTQLSAALFRAVHTGSRVVLIGDPDQLPAVGAGNVLYDIIKSGVANVVHLKRIHRQHKGSEIVDLCHRIKDYEQYKREEGRNPIRLWEYERGNVVFIQEEDRYKIAERIIELYKNLTAEEEEVFRGRSSASQYTERSVRILIHTYKGNAGITRINNLLQQDLSIGKTFMVAGKPWRVRDQVVFTRNDLHLGLVNGSLGEILAIDPETHTVTVRFFFENITISLDYSDMTHMQQARAMSVHKSQGSEFPIVILGTHMEGFPLLVRNLIYTGCSRAKVRLFIVGDQKAFMCAVRNNKVKKRHTGLYDELMRQQHSTYAPEITEEYRIPSRNTTRNMTLPFAS